MEIARAAASVSGVNSSIQQGSPGLVMARSSVVMDRSHVWTRGMPGTHRGSGRRCEHPDMPGHVSTPDGRTLEIVAGMATITAERLVEGLGT